MTVRRAGVVRHSPGSKDMNTKDEEPMVMDVISGRQPFKIQQTQKNLYVP
jgi:hypothetical protein